MVAISCATFIIGPLSPPSACASAARLAGAVALAAEQARAGHPRRDAADIGADPRIARGAGGEAVGLVRPCLAADHDDWDASAKSRRLFKRDHCGAKSPNAVARPCSATELVCQCRGAVNSSRAWKR